MRWLFLAVVASAGCIRAENPHEGEDVGGDADSDTDGTTCESACDGTIGHDIGNRFEGFAFASCDGSTSVTNDDSVPPCDVLLFNVSTGWCLPCQKETPRFQRLHEEHPTGLSIVQVLYQDDTSAPPGPTFCDEWSNDRFPEPLTFDVLIDTAGTAANYFDNPSAQMPLNIVVDRNGCVANNWVGTPPAGEPEAAIESLL